VSAGTGRVLSADLRAHAVPPASADPLVTSLQELADGVGLWDAGPGVDHDVEADEVFLVLEGEGVVTFEEDGSTLDLRPGVLVHLRAGDRTRWEITRRLRKIYVS
jgi:uncharacterized protein